MRQAKAVDRIFGATLLLGFALPATPSTIFFTTGSPDGLMAMASRPGASEIETADDFLISGSNAQINSATFTGLITNSGTIGQVVVELYRIFPDDSNTSRPITVPTRVNSPSDVDFDSRDSAASSLSFTTTLLGAFSASNSVLNGIAVNTGGEGSVRGNEVTLSVDFATPFLLTPGHYFIVPQVAVTGGDFYWLSAPRPAFTGDLQTWIRNSSIAPDWLRVGTDIVGSGAFNGSFSITGIDVPEPATLAMIPLGLAGLALRRYWRAANRRPGRES